jgi:tRNA threonylcarbamoyladenosine biosynthesis protein TsaB
MAIYLLHLDTSTDTGTVAISKDGLLVAHRTNEESRNHAATINIMIAGLLADTEISFGDLSAIVVCGGPGSYTGLRIGMATAKGLCYALDKPLLVDNRLTLLAFHACKQNENFARYISLLTAREKEYFISIYDKDFICRLPPQHITEDQLVGLIAEKESILIITDAPDYIFKTLSVSSLQMDTNIKTNLSSWCFYSYTQFNCNNIVNLSTAEPFYLKQVYTHK